MLTKEHLAHLAEMGRARLEVALLSGADAPEDEAALAERLLDLHKKLAAATIPADGELYQRQIEVTDRQIDALVYDLYGVGRRKGQGEITIAPSQLRGSQDGLQRSILHHTTRSTPLCQRDPLR